MAGKTDLSPETTEEAGSTVSKEDAKRALRRRILKAGAIGAPLVITLRSNSGWAASVTCLQTLKVPENINNQNYAHSDGPLVPFNSSSPDHRRYMNALSHDSRMSGMPGYSCVASIMMTKP